MCTCAVEGGKCGHASHRQKRLQPESFQLETEGHQVAAYEPAGQYNATETSSCRFHETLQAVNGEEKKKETSK